MPMPDSIVEKEVTLALNSHAAERQIYCSSDSPRPFLYHSTVTRHDVRL
jgi:hypothetical protein